MNTVDLLFLIASFLTGILIIFFFTKFVEFVIVRAYKFYTEKLK